MNKMSSNMVSRNNSTGNEQDQQPEGSHAPVVLDPAPGDGWQPDDGKEGNAQHRPVVLDETQDDDNGEHQADRQPKSCWLPRCEQQVRDRVFDTRTLGSLKRAIDGVISDRWHAFKNGSTTLGHWTEGADVGVPATSRATSSLRCQWDLPTHDACIAVTVPRSRKKAAIEQCITIGGHPTNGWTALCIIPCTTTDIYIADGPGVAGSPMSHHKALQALRSVASWKS